MKTFAGSIAIFSLIVILVLSLAPPTHAQSLPQSIPSSPAFDSEESSKSLADFLKTDLMKRLRDAAKKNESPGSNGRSSRSRRPRSDRSVQEPYEPIDMSEFMGPNADPNKTLDHLRRLGKIPLPDNSPEPNIPSASPGNDVWEDVEPAKRLQHAESLLKRRKFLEGLQEVENVLNQKLEGEPLIDALALRGKFLFHRRHYDTVQSDYFRLKDYYPNKKQVGELKTYLESESGLKPLQDKVMESPKTPQAQRELLNQYLKYNWLDLAEEFFAETIRDTSSPTIESLSEVYYRKQDYEMLAELAQAAQGIYPKNAVHYYNEGVGWFHQGDEAALKRAKEAFAKAMRAPGTPAVRKNTEWYMNKLANVK